MTECAHCPRKFKTFEEYAQHILDRHPDDEIRVAWANELLHSQEVVPVVAVPVPEESDELDKTLEAILRPEILKKLREKK